MENEIIEEYTTDEIIIEESNEEVLETDDISGEVSNDNNTDVLESVDNISSSYDSTESESLEELLRKYFSESEEEASIRGASDSGSEESSQIDYTEILNDLLTVSEDQATLETSIYEYFETYEENNNIHASVDDISLTNVLLLVIFMGLLFTATINFARRIL